MYSGTDTRLTTGGFPHSDIPGSKLVKALHERETFMRCWDVAHNQRHVTQVVWGYMVKRLSAFGGCLGGNRR